MVRMVCIACVPILDRCNSVTCFEFVVKILRVTITHLSRNLSHGQLLFSLNKSAAFSNRTRVTYSVNDSFITVPNKVEIYDGANEATSDNLFSDKSS